MPSDESSSVRGQKNNGNCSPNIKDVMGEYLKFTSCQKEVIYVAHIKFNHVYK